MSSGGSGTTIHDDEVHTYLSECLVCVLVFQGPSLSAPPVRVCAVRVSALPPDGHGRRFHLRPYRIPMDTLRVKHSAVLDLVTTLLGEKTERRERDGWTMRINRPKQQIILHIKENAEKIMHRQQQSFMQGLLSSVCAASNSAIDVGLFSSSGLGTFETHAHRAEGQTSWETVKD